MPDSFLQERSDFKALVATVADSEKINDPALVEKDWIMHAVFGLKQLGLTLSSRVELRFPRALGSWSESLKTSSMLFTYNKSRPSNANVGLGIYKRRLVAGITLGKG
jgi:hypothetical protein